jgi:hypothetical protein
LEIRPVSVHAKLAKVGTPFSVISSREDIEGKIYYGHRE